MIAEILAALEDRKQEIAKLTIERVHRDSFDESKGRYTGLNDAITIIRNLVAEKGRMNDDF